MKTTNLRLRHSIRTVSIVANPDKKKATLEVPRLKSWLQRRGIKPLSSLQIAESDLVITLGGDGTILAIAQRAAEAGVPILGVNIGHMGFMTAVELDQLYKALAACLANKWEISERMMLDVQAPRESRSLLALNDAVIRIGATTRVTSIAASIEKESLGLFVGDGVIVATSTGSTAYSLAAQGPVVHPDLDALILTPICPHSFTQRTVVFPASQTLELELRDTRSRNEVQLCLDGQRVFVLTPGDRVSVRKSRYKIQLLKDPERPYFGVLREKLSWGDR